MLWESAAERTRKSVEQFVSLGQPLTESGFPRAREALERGRWGGREAYDLHFDFSGREVDSRHAKARAEFGRSYESASQLSEGGSQS